MAAQETAIESPFDWELSNFHGGLYDIDEAVFILV